MRWRWSWLSAVCESFLRNVYEGWNIARESLPWVVSVSVSPSERFFDGSRTRRIASSSESAARGAPRISRTALARTSSLFAFQSTRRETRPPSSRSNSSRNARAPGRMRGSAWNAAYSGVSSRGIGSWRTDAYSGSWRRTSATICPTTSRCSVGRVVGLAQPPVAKERDPRDRVVQVRERRDRQDVPRDLLRPLLDGPREARARRRRACAPGRARSSARRRAA